MNPQPRRIDRWLAWLSANWYWIVLPTVVAAGWWAWKQYRNRSNAPAEPLEPEK